MSITARLDFNHPPGIWRLGSRKRPHALLVHRCENQIGPFRVVIQVLRRPRHADTCR